MNSYQKSIVLPRSHKSFVPVCPKWHHIQPWILAARPKTLPAALCPVFFAISVAVSQGCTKWLSLFVVVLCAVLIQIICNFANDLYDFLKGADTEERIGPKRAVQSGLISPAAMRRALNILVGFCVLLGCLLVNEGGWPILAIGIVSLVAAFAYTSGPIPLAYRGLGELFVLIFFGPVPVYGTLLIATGQRMLSAIVIGFGIAALASALIVVNNVRDREQDEKVEKRTVAVRLGEPWCRYEFGVWLGVASLAPFIALCVGAPVGVIGGSVVSIVQGRSVLNALLRAQDAASFSVVLAKTVVLLVAYTIVVTLGWIFS